MLRLVSLRPAMQRTAAPLRAMMSSDTKASSETSTEEAAAEPEAPHAKASNSETVTGPAREQTFQAETRKLLDIVARSLYTDKEVFVRELVSNASDALEKARHAELQGDALTGVSRDNGIYIYTDGTARTITIQDTGIGMTDEELTANLGTIARSGSGEFIKQLEDGAAASSIIGQFGVGFYSAFVVGNKVTVYTKSARDPASHGYAWTSDGTGSYSIAEAEGVERGTKIVIELNEESSEFATSSTIKAIVKKYSNFVNYPIFVDGERVNTVDALWLRDKADITPEEHERFYQFVFHAWDKPTYSFVFSTDSPISVRSIFYIPSMHTEKMGMGRMDPGVSLYSRKVLIQGKAKGLLPDWMRFVKGVVDSEDVPLNLSREHLQDSMLIRRLNSVLTKRVLRMLHDESKADEEKYLQFYQEFQGFLKEGCVSDVSQKDALARLLRYETSTHDSMQSLDAYVDRMQPEQDSIYYIHVPTRAMADASPYLEAFTKNNMEVLYLYDPRDEFVMGNLATYKEKKLISVESADVKLPDAAADASSADAQSGLSDEAAGDFATWLTSKLGARVESVTPSKRLHGSPAIVVDHDATFRRMMRYVDGSRVAELPAQKLEFNPNHHLITRLDRVRREDEALATTVAEQVFDNALVAAGLVDDPRVMLERITNLMDRAMSATSSPSSS